MNTQPRGKVTFEFHFRATCGRSWPRMMMLANNMTMSNNEITDQDTCVTLELQDYAWDRAPNNISIAYFSKTERETVMRDGSIVADQSLELVKVLADDILLEPWFWTDHCYYPDYFRGYLEQCPDAPKKIKSQLCWHFPGRFMLLNLPVYSEFWTWYHEQRTTRILKDLVDPTGQIKNNHRGLTNEDRELIKELKDTLYV
jgi:hypothetical protein